MSGTTERVEEFVDTAGRFSDPPSESKGKLMGRDVQKRVGWALLGGLALLTGAALTLAGSQASVEHATAGHNMLVTGIPLMIVGLGLLLGGCIAAARRGKRDNERFFEEFKATWNKRHSAIAAALALAILGMAGVTLVGSGIGIENTPILVAGFALGGFAFLGAAAAMCKASKWRNEESLPPNREPLSSGLGEE